MASYFYTFLFCFVLFCLFFENSRSFLSFFSVTDKNVNIDNRMYKLFPEMAIETEAFYDKFSLQWQSTRKRKENPLTTLDSSYRKSRA